MRNFARALRLIGRVLLASGTILAAGAITFFLYSVFDEDFGSSVVAPEVPAPEGGGVVVQTGVRTSAMLWSGIIVVLTIAFMFVLMNKLNVFMRETIDKIAKFVRLDILMTEVLLTAIAWTILIVALLFYMPVGSIAIAVILLVNIWCFFGAWLAYGRRKYKI